MRGKKQPFKAVIFWSLLIFLLILGSSSAKFWFAFKKSSLRGLARVSFVLADSASQVILFSFQDQEGLIVNLKAKDAVQLPRGFGEYELDKVYPLGELEGRGGQLLKETIEYHLQVPIFGFFYDGSGFTYEPQSLKKFFSEIFKRAITKKTKSDLATIDLILLLLRTRRLGEQEIKIRDTVDSLIDRQLRGEGYSLEVLNATDHPGLAQQALSLLEKSGARVVRAADDSQARKSNLLITPSQ